MLKVYLHKNKDLSLKRFHPWIFSGAINITEGEMQDGDLVEVYSAEKKYLGTGHYNKTSISIRLLTYTREIIDENFWIAKIRQAYQYRLFLGLAVNKATNTYRLVFGEGDGLPGLVIDYFNGHAVTQCHNIGMYRVLRHVAEALKQVYGNSLQTIYDKSKDALPKNFALGVQNRYLHGSVPGTVVQEYGHSFLVDWEKGQKTGFYIDQRENRQLLSGYCREKKVLNSFSYTGAFSVYAGAGGAKEVHSCDSSSPALAMADKNMALNNLKNHQGFCADVFDFLGDKQDVYDIIILDPPAFAKSKDAKHHAINGYKRLNTEALKQIKKGGILFTFSCSGVIDKNLFYNTINAAAFESGRHTKILHYLHQPADHPISPNFPEGEYLKGLALYVE